MKIGKVEEEREFAPRIIPITIPEPAKKAPEEPGIAAPYWPTRVPVTVPAEPQKV